MRTIKFRAWDKERKEMYVFDLDSFNSDDGSQWLNCEDNKILYYGGIEWKNCELMQFTELHDKNGKDIYFGDILQTSNDGIDGCDVWSKDDFGYTICCEEEDELGVSFTKWHPSRDEESVYAFQYCEVIGNIHENPELLVALEKENII